MDPLTPNTSALLDYIAANYDASGNNLNLLNGANENMSFPGTFFDSASSLPTVPAIQTTHNANVNTNKGAGLGSGMLNSLPPSAFNMPVPGRDTPEATPESSNSNGTGNSPVERAAAAKKRGTSTDVDADAEGDGGSDSDALVAITDTADRRKSKGAAGQGVGAQNKRKAGHAHKVEQISDEDDESESDEPAGHEDKRQHPNDRLDPLEKKGPRKSKGEEGPKLTKETKAARRKEQNRAAQKAFRERREAKVKDLEDHIAELEAKSKGQSTENENLRNLLRTLQDENVRLKQSAFTFQMPVTGTSTPQSGSAVATAPTKVPSPPASRSANDNASPLSRSTTNAPIFSSTSTNTQVKANSNGNSSNAQTQMPNFLQHRSSTGGSSAPADSPQSMTSGTTGSTSSVPSAQAHPTFDSADMFNAFASGVRPEWFKQPFGQNQQNQQMQQSQPQAQQQPSRQTSTSSSIPSLSPPTSENAELQALWASFFPQGSNNPQGNTANTYGQQQQQQQTQQAGNGNINGAQVASHFNNLGNAEMSPFNLFATNGQVDNNANMNIPDKMAFRDNNDSSSNLSALAQFKTGFTPGIPAQGQPQVFDWNQASDDSGVNDFLASLMGNPDTSGSFEPQDVSAEDAFTAQLQKLLDQSSSGAAAALNSPDQLFGLPSNNNVNVPGSDWMNFGMGMGNGMGNTYNSNAMLGANSIGNGMSGSPSNNNGGSGWSPSNYLNMSPFASSGSASASDSPSSNLRDSSVSLSNSASPEPMSGVSAQGGHMPMPASAAKYAHANGNVGSAGSNKAMSPNTTVVQVPAADPDGGKRAVQHVFAAAKRGDVVHVVGEDGQILKPSDVWVRMGMHHSNQVADLLIDDLCDQMKQKATCQDGSYRLSVKDAERMFKYKGEGASEGIGCPTSQ